MDFISIGCSVLLTDVDVIWVTDPFLNGLYRDSDVEGMSDGWDEVRLRIIYYTINTLIVEYGNRPVFKRTAQGLEWARLG